MAVSLALDAQEEQLRIDRPCRADNIGVGLAGIELHRTVFHVIAAIEREAMDVGLPYIQFDWFKRFVGVRDD